MSLIIGITGQAGAGKDTAAEALAQLGSFRCLSFAGPIKGMLSTAFGFSGDNWQDREWKEKTDEQLGKSPRQMAQTLGTEWGRELVHPDIWIMATDRAISFMRSQNADLNFVIPDVRFENEAKYIRDHGGVIVEITRTILESVSPHASEQGIALGYIDFIINNTESIEYLQDTMRAYVLTQLARQYAVSDNPAASSSS